MLIKLLTSSYTSKTEVTISFEKLMAIIENIWRHNSDGRIVNEIVFDGILILLTDLLRYRHLHVWGGIKYSVLVRKGALLC